MRRSSMLPRGPRRYWLLALIFVARLCYHIAFKCRGFLDPGAVFFRGIALKAVRGVSIPPPLALDDELRIVSLVCHRDVTLWLWSYLSCRHFSDFFAPVLIFDDGTLTDDDVELLRRWPEISIIYRKEADRKVMEFYGSFPAVLKYRHEMLLSRKVIDPPAFIPAGKRILLFDSDLLFFRRPLEVMAALQQPRLEAMLYASEEQASYAAQPELTERYPHLPYGFNSGLLVYERDWLDAEKLDFLCMLVKSLPPMKVPYDDQIILAILASEYGYMSLPDSYGASMSRKPEALVMKHYHSWMKHFYIQEGLWYLLRHP